jgi:uncharacterized protein YbcI
MASEPEGEALAAVSTAIVGIHSEFYGRGPTKAKTYAFDSYMLTVLEDLLTTVERTLVEKGEEDLVRTVRVTFQEQTAERMLSEVSRIIGRPVLAYHSQVTFHPPMGFEFFVLADEG